MIHHLASRIWMFLLLLKISDVILYFGLPKCLFKSNVNKSWQCQILSLWFLETSEVFIVYWRKLDTFFWTIKQILGKTLNNLWTITKALLSINLPISISIMVFIFSSLIPSEGNVKSIYNQIVLFNWLTAWKPKFLF